jgi:hypothetical protein
MGSRSMNMDMAEQRPLALGEPLFLAIFEPTIGRILAWSGGR